MLTIGVSLSSILELLDLRKWAVPLKLETGGGNNTQVGFGRFRSPGPDSDVRVGKAGCTHFDF